MGKNTVRKVTDKTRQIVLDRDNGCVCCGTQYGLERTPHHAWYGGEANYGPNRNDPDQLVTICMFCHREIHDKGDQLRRQRCKDYLKDIYD